MAFAAGSDHVAEIQRLTKQIASLDDERIVKEKELRDIVESIAELRRKKEFHDKELANSSTAVTNEAAAAGGGGGSSWNVRSWHWEERDVNTWAKQRITELLTGYSVADKATGDSVKVASLTSIEGDAYINVRKGKKIAGFEFKLKGKWEGFNAEGKAVAEGVFTVPDFSNDLADDDAIEFELTCKGEDKLKTLMKKKCMPAALTNLCQLKREIMELKDRI